MIFGILSFFSSITLICQHFKFHFLGQAVQCIVSNRRIKEFLAEEELEKIPPGDANLSCYSVCIRNASFSWDLDGDFFTTRQSK